MEIVPPSVPSLASEGYVVSAAAMDSSDCQNAGGGVSIPLVLAGAQRLQCLCLLTFDPDLQELRSARP